MRLTELFQPWLRPFVSAVLWCCLSSAQLVISLHSSFLVDIGGCKGNIWCPILLAVNQCTWGRVPAKPRGVTAFFLFFSLSEGANSKCVILLNPVFTAGVAVMGDLTQWPYLTWGHSLTGFPAFKQSLLSPSTHSM